MRGHLLVWKDIERRDYHRAAFTPGTDQVEEGLDRLEQRLGLLVAVDDHHQRALRLDGQKGQIEGFGGRSEPGQRG
jgi:hypothetical protein